MNLFAHAVLAGTDPLHIAAGIVADRIKGVPGQEPFTLLPLAVQQGVIQHRSVDSLTDVHPLLGEARSRFGVSSRRIAGILLDLYCDLLLHTHWGRWDLGDRKERLQRARAALQSSTPLLTPEAADWARFIVQNDLLAACATMPGLVDTAQRLGRRLRHPEAFADGLLVLDTQGPQLDALCLAFMDELFQGALR